MGGLEVINCQNIQGAFMKYGASYVSWKECLEYEKKHPKCSNTSDYHKKKAKKWLSVCMEAKQFMNGSNLTDKKFKQLLFKYFEKGVIKDLHFSRTNWTIEDTVPKATIKKWLNEAFDSN